MPPIMLKRLAVLAATLALCAAAPALAAAPEPTRKVDIAQMTGRWYEIARLPNAMQRGCEGGWADWRKDRDGFSVIQACHKGDPSAPATEWRAKGKVVDPASNNKIRMSFFGGLLSQEYWVLDQRANEGWFILATPGGHALWLMAKRPSLTPAAQAAALARIRQLGYDVSKLEFPAPAVN